MMRLIITSQGKSFKYFLSAILALTIGFSLSPASLFAKSDWVEDERERINESETQNTVSQPALDNSGKPVLQGSASMTGSTPSRTNRPLTTLDLAKIEFNVNRFLQSAQTNVVVPPAAFRGWLEKTHPQYLSASAQFSNDAVVEVKGQWDDSSKTLRSLGIRHQVIKAKQLRDIPLNGTYVLVINCAGTVPKESLQAIRNFVIQGGYLLSTDWSLDNMLAKAFPGYVVWNGGKTPGTVVDATVLDHDPILLAGTNLQRSTWKLDKESQMVRVLKPNLVRVLAVSQRLSPIDPNNNINLEGTTPQTGVLAVEFAFGRGRILHLVGHFDNNSPSFRQNLIPDPTPEGISLRQIIATNFVIAGLMSHKK